METLDLTIERKRLEDSWAALESLQKIEAALENYSEEGISSESAHYLQLAVNGAISPIGLNFGLSDSFESFDNHRRLTSLNASMESIRKLIEEIIQAIIKVFTDLKSGIQKNIDLIGVKIHLAKRKLADVTKSTKELNLTKAEKKNDTVTLSLRAGLFFKLDDRDIITVNDIRSMVGEYRKHANDFKLHEKLSKLSKISDIVESVVELKSNLSLLLPTSDPFFKVVPSSGDYKLFSANKHLVDRYDAVMGLDADGFENSTNFDETLRAVRRMTLEVNRRGDDSSGSVELPLLEPSEFDNVLSLAEDLLEIAKIFNDKSGAFIKFRNSDIFNFKTHDSISESSHGGLKAFYFSLENILNENSRLLHYLVTSSMGYSAALRDYVERSKEQYVGVEVSQEDLGTILGGAFLGTLAVANLAMWGWDKYSKARQKKMRDSSDPDVRAESFRFTDREKLAKETRDKINKTYLNHDWLIKQNFINDEIDGKGIVEHLGSGKQSVDHLKQLFQNADRTVEAFIAATQKANDKLEDPISKIITIAKKANADNLKETTEEITRVSKTAKLPIDVVTQVTTFPIAHSNKASSTQKIAALKQDEIKAAADILLKATIAIDKHYKAVDELSFALEWDSFVNQLDASIKNDLMGELIESKVCDIFLETESMHDAHLYYKVTDVVDDLVVAALALERWIYRSIRH